MGTTGLKFSFTVSVMSWEVFLPLLFSERLCVEVILFDLECLIKCPNEAFEDKSFFVERFSLQIKKKLIHTYTEDYSGYRFLLK